MIKRTQSESGVALLVTLLAVALMTTVVVDFTYSANSSYRSAANQVNELRADYLARSGIAIGLGMLAQDARIDTMRKMPFDAMTDLWAMPVPPIPAGGGFVSVSIEDEARKININQLVNQTNGAVNETAFTVLSRLFATVGVSQDVLSAVVDWIDPDSVPFGGGAEASYYLGLKPPYEPRNGPMPTIGDLRMVRGVDDVTYAKLSDVLTVAPETRINVNTALPEVLAALIPSPAIVGAILKARMAQPFMNVMQLNELPQFGEHAAQLGPLFNVRSNFFTIMGIGNYAGARKLVHAMFRRNGAQSTMLASWRED